MKQNLWILGTWVLGWPLWNICVTNDHGYVPLVMNTFRSFPYSRLITRFVTRLTRRVPLVEQELLPLTRSLCTYFVDSCLSICTFSFGHCVFCSSSIYGFWLPLWYLQTPLPSLLFVCPLTSSWVWFCTWQFTFGISCKIFL